MSFRCVRAWRLEAWRALLLAVTDDEPHAPPESAIVPHPLHEDEQPVAKADEIHEVNEEPQEDDIAF